MLKVIQKFKVGSAVGLGVVGLATIPGLSFAYAETSTPLNLTANVAEAGLSVTLPKGNNAVLNLAAPYTGAATDSTSVTVQVATHNGYQLFMVGDTALSQSGENAATIPVLGSSCASGCDISSSNFTTNAWGYNVGAANTVNESTSYKGLPTRSDKLANQNLSSYAEIGNGAGEVTGDTYYLNFAAKVDHTQAPGVYTGTINFIAVADPSSNRTYMQFMDASECTDTAQPVYDSRDNKSYMVKKLADGKCWMLDNLALDLVGDSYNEGTTVLDVMNSLNTNASNQSIAILKGGASAVEGLDNTSGKYANSGIMNNKNETATAPYWGKSDTEDNNCANSTGANACTDNWTVPRTNNSKISAKQNQNWTTDVNSDGEYTVGVYYNYCAASAGTYCYAKASSPENTNATEDVCPAGWSLPTGGSSGEFQTLYGKYGATAVGGANGYAFRAALSTPLSGYVYSSSGAVVYVGAVGNWWSSTRSGSNGMYGLNMGASNVYPASDDSRSNGFSIRCVLR